MVSLCWSLCVDKTVSTGTLSVCLFINHFICLSFQQSCNCPCSAKFYPCNFLCICPRNCSCKQWCCTNTGCKRQLETLLGRKWAILSPDYTDPFPNALIKYSIIWTLFGVGALAAKAWWLSEQACRAWNLRVSWNCFEISVLLATLWKDKHGINGNQMTFLKSTGQCD